jgi:pimeloyl-ACP methyl ester carboxylesterase
MTLPPPSEQQESFAARDGTRLAYRLYRAAAAKAVIIVLPGFALDSKDYMAFCRTLMRFAVTLYSPDLRGHGCSEGRPGDVDHVGQLGEDLADLCAHVRATNPGLPLILCAHSSGCSLAIAFLSRAAPPEGLAALFLIAPVFCGYLEYDRHQTLVYRLTHLGRYFALPARVPPPHKAEVSGQQFRYYLWRSLFGRLLPGHQRQIVLAVDSGRNGGWRRFTRRFYDSYRCPDLTSRLSGLPCVTWAMVGCEDEFTIPEAVVSTLRWHVPPRQLREIRLLKGVGHFTIFRLAALVLARWVQTALDEPADQRNAA